MVGLAHLKLCHILSSATEPADIHKQMLPKKNLSPIALKCHILILMYDYNDSAA